MLRHSVLVGVIALAVELTALPAYAQNPDWHRGEISRMDAEQDYAEAGSSRHEAVAANYQSASAQGQVANRQPRGNSNAGFGAYYFRDFDRLEDTADSLFVWCTHVSVVSIDAAGELARADGYALSSGEGWSTDETSIVSLTQFGDGPCACVGEVSDTDGDDPERVSEAVLPDDSTLWILVWSTSGVTSWLPGTSATASALSSALWTTN